MPACSFGRRAPPLRVRTRLGALPLLLLGVNAVVTLSPATAASITYTKLADTDFSSPIHGGWARRSGTPGPCGPGDGKKLPVCNITFLKAVCANLCGCAGPKAGAQDSLRLVGICTWQTLVRV